MVGNCATAARRVKLFDTSRDCGTISVDCMCSASAEKGDEWTGCFFQVRAFVCLDNGTNDCWDDLAGVVDLMGVNRLVGKSVDIGCCERQIAGTRMLVR